jgi:hypothetical protein
MQDDIQQRSPGPPRTCGQHHNGVTGVQPLDRLAALMRRQLEGSPEPHAAPLGSLPAFAGARLDERPLEFGEAPEDRQALAVFMLMISSTFVACCTGRSAGFSPLRIRPA